MSDTMKKRIACLVFLIFALHAAAADEDQAVETATILNVLPGLGLGSFIQGNAAGGLAQMGGELIGFAGLFFGVPLLGMSSSFGSDARFPLALICGGVGFLLVSKTLGFILPGAFRQPAAEGGPLSPAAAIALNFLPGFGIGSFIQGNTAGGLVQLGGELAGYAGVIGGILLLQAAGSLTEDRTAGFAIGYSGLALILVTKMIGIIWPKAYQTAAAGR